MPPIGESCPCALLPLTPLQATPVRCPFRYHNPDNELNLENPEDTLAKHPLIELLQKSVSQGGLGMLRTRYSQCMFSDRYKRKGSDWLTTCVALNATLRDTDGAPRMLVRAQS